MAADMIPSLTKREIGSSYSVLILHVSALTAVEPSTAVYSPVIVLSNSAPHEPVMAAVPV